MGAWFRRDPRLRNRCDCGRRCGLPRREASKGYRGPRPPGGRRPHDPLRRRERPRLHDRPGRRGLYRRFPSGLVTVYGHNSDSCADITEIVRMTFVRRKSSLCPGKGASHLAHPWVSSPDEDISSSGLETHGCKQIIYKKKLKQVTQVSNHSPCNDRRRNNGRIFDS